MFNKLKVYLAASIGYLLIRALYLTQSWTVNYHSEDAQQCFKIPCAVAIWHNRVIMTPFLLNLIDSKSNLKIFALVSKHTDGRIIASLINFFGIGSVAGSSSRGGKEALLQQIDLLKAGSCAVITPDGPRGPIYKLKPGVIKLASATQTPIFPVTVTADKKWTFNSWDKMILPKPFARGVFHIGEPFYVPKDLSEKEFTKKQLELEAVLNNFVQSTESV